MVVPAQYGPVLVAVAVQETLHAAGAVYAVVNVHVGSAE